MAYLFAGLLLAAIAWSLWLYSRGRKVQRADDLEESNEVKDAQLEAANQRRDADAVIERLRRGGF